MSDLCEAAEGVAPLDQPCPLIQQAIGLYLSVNRSDLKAAIEDYASKHRISVSTAVAEACRSYFLGE